MAEKDRVLVLIPAFNEEERIGTVIEEVKKYLPEGEVVVINDGSADRTADVIIKAGAKVINLPFNLGVGSALQTGYKFAIKEGYDYVIQLDADGQHVPSFLPVFLEKIRRTKSDLVIGSRFLSPGPYAGSRVRRIGIIFFARLTSFLIRQRLTDPLSGYRAMKRAVVELCSRDAYTFDYPDADFLLALHRQRFKIEEIPVTMNPRKGGQSQHRGLGPIFYIFKIMLSILVNLLRKNERSAHGD
ncbi:MAG: glycosyltransferase family 2 protein [Candidatus Omnitrophota bacterium]